MITKSQKYLIDRLHEMLVELPKMKAKLESDTDLATHYIEISPKEMYQNNYLYKLFETRLIEDFEEKFPFENICFISSDDFITLNKPFYIVRR